jgi:hypothetical protein
VLNETALALWELCDGGTTADEMVSAICVLFDADRRVIAADVQRILREFELCHLVESVPDGGAFPRAMTNSGLGVKTWE